MKYCKKCGAELAEGVSFCEKCGNPVGQMPKRGKGKKKWILAISSGVIILAVAVVGGLFATGIIRGKGDVAETDTNTADIQETPGSTGGIVANTQEPEADKQKDSLNNNDSKDMAWEAYVAYKAYLKGQENGNENEDEDEYSAEYTDTRQISLVYLDEDDYPELIVFHSNPTVDNHFLYTYKNGEVINTEYIATDIYYKKREGYIFNYSRHTIGTTCDIVDVLKGTYTECVYRNNYESELEESMEDSDYKVEEHFDSPDEVAGKCGITGGWDEPVYGENIDEAYTQLLSVGVR